MRKVPDKKQAADGLIDGMLGSLGIESSGESEI
jgi:hypothetical protein